VLFAEKLMRLGKNVDVVSLPSSVHDAMRKDYVATFTLHKLVEHFDRYLGRGPTGGRPTDRPIDRAPAGARSTLNVRHP
jgi:hypothetical protein